MTAQACSVVYMYISAYYIMPIYGKQGIGQSCVVMGSQFQLQTTLISQPVVARYSHISQQVPANQSQKVFASMARHLSPTIKSQPVWSVQLGSPRLRYGQPGLLMVSQPWHASDSWPISKVFAVNHGQPSPASITSHIRLSIHLQQASSIHRYSGAPMITSHMLPWQVVHMPTQAISSPGQPIINPDKESIRKWPHFQQLNCSLRLYVISCSSMPSMSNPNHC